MKEYSECIKKWIDNRMKNNNIVKARFYISSKKYDENENFYQNPLINRIEKMFEDSGIKTSYCDTIPGAFNLNRNYLETDIFDAVVEYCGVYPIKMDTKISAWLSDLDDKGEIRITVCTYDENGNEHMNI